MRSGRRQNLIDDDVVGMSPGQGHVIGGLHPHQRISLDAESLLEPDGHLGRQGRAPVEQVAESLPRDVEAGRQPVDADAMRLDNFAFQPVARVNR